MHLVVLRITALIVVIAAPNTGRPCLAEQIGERFFDLTRETNSVATLVVPEEDAPIWADAVKMITGPARRWSGAAPRVVRLAKDAPLPPGDVILIGTPQTSSTIAALTERTESPISNVPFIDDQGFAVESRTDDDGKRLIIAGKTPRGAYNGAVICRDFVLDATPGEPGKADVFVRTASIVRSPQMAARGTYLLSIYGVAMKYTAEDWMKIIDRFAEDGMDRVYFWLSGHHPSEKYPNLYNVDGAAGTKLTVDGVKRLIRYCHDRDIDFYIGGGAFAWTASHYLINDHPEIAAVEAGALCPSKPYARTANREHFLEMLDTWSESDGFMLEVRDEQGECKCEVCKVPLDKFGSRAYGQAEITWLQELSREAWKRNPKLKFCWLIGYAEHKDDVSYYDQIRSMNDPRFEWLETRVGLDGQGKWVLPGPGGIERPFAFFSPKIIHWDPFYVRPLDHLLHWARRIADEGLYGYCPAFEPGYSSSSYYSEDIPIPVNILPHCLTGFAFREVTWDPGITFDELKARVQRRYFSPQAPERFGEDMIYLRRFSLDHWKEICRFAKTRFGYAGERVEPLTLSGEFKRVEQIADENQQKAEREKLLTTCKKLADVQVHLDRMTEIESALDAAAPQATPKTLESFEIMRKMIADTHRLYQQAVPDPSFLTSANERSGG